MPSASTFTPSSNSMSSMVPNTSMLLIKWPLYSSVVYYVSPYWMLHESRQSGVQISALAHCIALSPQSLLFPGVKWVLVVEWRWLVAVELGCALAGPRRCIRECSRSRLLGCPSLLPCVFSSAHQLSWSLLLPPCGSRSSLPTDTPHPTLHRNKKKKKNMVPENYFCPR